MTGAQALLLIGRCAAHSACPGPNPTTEFMKMLIRCSLLTALLLTPVFGAGNWHTDFEAAKKQAAKEKKDLLIDFTGSDWCGWCIRLKKEVFDEAAFEKGVADHFVLVELDYPRDKSKLSEKTKAQSKLPEAQLKKALERAERDLAERKASLENTHQGLRKNETALKELRGRIHAKEQELTKLKKALRDGENKAGMLKKKHDEGHRAEADTKNTMDGIEAELKRRATIAHLESEAAKLQRKAEELRKQAERLRD